MRKLLLGLALAMALPAFAAEHWIDVRVPQQYQKEHVVGAVNIPLADLKTRIAAEVPDKNDTIHVYCNVGQCNLLIIISLALMSISLVLQAQQDGDEATQNRI